MWKTGGGNSHHHKQEQESQMRIFSQIMKFFGGLMGGGDKQPLMITDGTVGPDMTVLKVSLPEQNLKFLFPISTKVTIGVLKNRMTTFLEENYLSNGRIELKDGEGVSAVCVDGYECADGSKVEDVLRVNEEVTIQLGKVGGQLAKRPPSIVDSKPATKKVNGSEQKVRKHKKSEELGSVGKISMDMSLEFPESPIPTVHASASKPAAKENPPKLQESQINPGNSNKPPKQKQVQTEKKLTKQPTVASIQLSNKGKQSPISKSPAPSHLKVENETSESETSEELKKPEKKPAASQPKQKEPTKSAFETFAGGLGNAAIDYTGSRMIEEPLKTKDSNQPLKSTQDGSTQEKPASKPKKPKSELKKTPENKGSDSNQGAQADGESKGQDQANPPKKRGRPKKNPEDSAGVASENKVAENQQQESQIEEAVATLKPQAHPKKKPVKPITSSEESSEDVKAKPVKPDSPKKQKPAKKESKAPESKPKPTKVQESEESSETDLNIPKSQKRQQGAVDKRSIDTTFKSAISGGSETSRIVQEERERQQVQSQPSQGLPSHQFETPTFKHKTLENKPEKMFLEDLGTRKQSLQMEKQEPEKGRTSKPIERISSEFTLGGNAHDSAAHQNSSFKTPAPVASQTEKKAPVNSQTANKKVKPPSSSESDDSDIPAKKVTAPAAIKVFRKKSSEILKQQNRADSSSDSSEPVAKKKPVNSGAGAVKVTPPVQPSKPKKKQSSDESSGEQESDQGLHEAKYSKFNKSNNIFSNNPLHKGNK